MAIDLTGGEVKVLGNTGDTHSFRLTNPVGQDLIAVGGTYEAEFRDHDRVSTPVVIDQSELAVGALIIPILITNGFYRIRRLNPRRTLLTIEVEAR